MSKRVTLKEVASRAHVSYQTVSKVLNQKAQVSKETEARIRRAVRALGYHPDYKARDLRTQRSRMLGYSWAAPPPDQVNPVLDLFLQSMMTAAEQAGYHVLPFPQPDRRLKHQVTAYRDLIDTGRVDAFILSSVEFDDPRVLFLMELNFPFVAFGQSGPDSDFPYVDVDGAEGLKMATEHLLHLGHRKIAALAWPKESRVGQNRLEGYLGALRRAGIPPRAGLIARGEGRVGFGYDATMGFLSQPLKDRPTAIVALCDAMGIGAMRAAQDCGLRVGTDLAITGFDDAPMVQFLTPPLTSVRQPTWDVGQRVISMLIDILEGKPPPETHVLVMPELIIRESSSAMFSLGQNGKNHVRTSVASGKRPSLSSARLGR